MIAANFSFLELPAALNGEWQYKPVESESDSVCGVSTDTREQMNGALFLALCGETFDAHDYWDQAVAHGAKVLCVEKTKSSRIPKQIPTILVDSTLAAFQSLGNYHRRRFPHLKVIALTGSCGKTGTKETLRAIFNHVFGAEHVLATEGNTNNQIGVPQNLLRLTPEHRYAIIEMGTNHHGEIAPLTLAAEPDAALVVSIGNCHLEFLGSLEGVASEKSKIFAGLEPHGTAVIPSTCPAQDVLRHAAESFHVLTFGFDPEADFRAEYCGGNISGSSFFLHEKRTGETVSVQWAIPGRHLAGNAAGAAAVASSFGISLQQIAEGISGTTLPGMRMRRTEHHNATWINDAYNANPDSMKASISWLSEFADGDHLLLVLGDMGEIGPGSMEAHINVLTEARRAFPNARILAVGKQMCDAVRALTGGLANTILTAEKSILAKQMILDVLRPEDLVFLKASRSTRLELAEPME